MGIAGSCGAKVKPQFDELWLDDFKQLSLTKSDVKKFYALFDKVSYGSKQINTYMALMALDINQTNFTVKIFAEMCNRNGHLDFKNFVLEVWNYCSLSFDMLARYIFSLYDNEQIKGQIHLKTILQILKDTHDEKTMTNAQKVITQIQNELTSQFKPTQAFDELDFVKMAQTHYELLLPAYTAQTQMRRVILGLKYWNDVTKKRSLVAEREYVDMSAYLFLLRKVEKAQSFQLLMGLKTKPKYAVCIEENSGGDDFYSGGILPDKTHKADQCSVRTTDTTSTYHSRASNKTGGDSSQSVSIRSSVTSRSGLTAIDCRTVIPVGGSTVAKSTTSTNGSSSGSDSGRDTPRPLQPPLSFVNIKEHYTPEEEEGRKLRVFAPIRLKTRTSSVSIERDVFVLDIATAPLRNKRVFTQRIDVYGI